MKTPRLGSLAGCRVLEWQIAQGSFVRVARNRRALRTGRIRRLQRFPELATRAAAGEECRIAFDGFEAFEPGIRWKPFS